MHRIALISAVSLMFICSVQAQDAVCGSTDTGRVSSGEAVFMNEQVAKMDSLLNIWYIKDEMSRRRSVLSDIEAAGNDTSAALNSDSVMGRRVGDIVTALPLAYNGHVRPFIELYSVRRKQLSSAVLSQAQYYYPWMRQIFDRYGLPEELVYLTIVESVLNPKAVSRAGATGIWQFMYQTGKLYGLEVNTFVDDRRDPYKATDAAARHLRDLYGIFGDWGLAISAYNCGAGNVRKAVQRSGGKTDFWSVYDYLPRETQSYFPAFIGAYYMMTYHHLYGIEPLKTPLPVNADTVMVHKELHFDQIAQVLNISKEEIEALNPQYKRDIVPAYKEAYPIRLRPEDLVRFIAMEDSIHRYKYDEYFSPARVQTSGHELLADGTPDRYHYVKRGESLSKIAARYGLSVRVLKSMNRLRSNTIHVNQRLLVRRGRPASVPAKPSPVSGSLTDGSAPPASAPAARDSAAAATAAAADTGQGTAAVQPATIQSSAPQQKQYMTYIVKKGDTLSAIADRYGSKVDVIAHYNGLSNKNSLRIGQKIRIPHHK